jgi:predicted ATPase/class 3 adenylate cyclase
MARSDLPTGTVSFLFTDVEGSTQLLRALGADRYAEALHTHRRLLREAAARHGGHEVDTQGDAFFFAFHRAADAARAAADSQVALQANPWRDGHELRVRMGIHTSEATATNEGYVGVGVHLGARICAAGHGGQVVLSQITNDLIKDEGAGLTTFALGEHRLKDLGEPQHLFQLAGQTLPGTFPPLRTLESHPTNLPAQASPLVGREREIGEIGDLLRRDGNRLVTLTGPGGTGKTRLALQSAAELLESFPHGVFFVPLAALKDSELVMPAVAQTLGVNEAAGQSLTGYLAAKELLLVMDNFEHVIDAAADMAELLASAPAVKVLATSREPLHLAAEQVYPVPPLALPDPRHLPEVATLRGYEAVALFVDRAQAVQPSFELNEGNAAAVAEICLRLEGLPLALELAAARISLLSPDAMLQRLGERLKLLRGGARDLPARQRTLTDAIAWSYDLLDDEERRVFAKLAVFAGGFILEAAETVCEAELDTLASLLAKSLIRRDGERFAMLEVVREFAIERLASHADASDVHARHATFFQELAESAFLERFEREGELSAELELEHDNLRAALEWLGANDPRRHLRMAGSLGWFWHVHSHLAEGRARLSQALAGESGWIRERARALSAAGELAAFQADVDAARPLVEEANATWADLGSVEEVALSLHDLGWGYFFAGKDEEARRCMEESMELLRPLGRPFLFNRSRIGLLQVLVSMRELDTVEQLAPEALRLAEELGDRRSEHFAHHFLADCPLIRGDCDTAEQRYLQALDLAVRLGDRSETAVEIQGLAMAAAGRSHPQRALRLATAAQAEFDALGIDISGIRFWTELLDRYLGNARADLGPEAAEEAAEQGRRMGFEQAIGEARAAE